MQSVARTCRECSRISPKTLWAISSKPHSNSRPSKEDLAGWFSTWRGLIGYEIGDLKIAVGDDIAYCHSLSRWTGARTDGEDTDIWFRETICLRKMNGQWLITHIHESVPMYMDGSLKAAIDLKP